MSQIKEQIKAPEKMHRRDEEIAHLSDAQFKTLVIRMLSHKMKEEMKAIQSEIKENIQRTNSEGKETRTHINDLEQKEEINIQPEKNEETEFKNMRRGLGTSGTTFNVPTSKS